MKRYLMALFFILSSSLVYSAAPLVSEAPISGYGTPVTIAISSTTLTKVPSSQTSGRVGVYVALPQGNTGMVGFFGDCSSTALASTIRPIEISSATGMFASGYFPIREDVCMWLLSLNANASTQNLNYQEIKK